jgi:hypothetical protein
MLQAGRYRVRVPLRSLNFFNLPNPTSHTVNLGYTQPLTEDLSKGKARPAHNADNLPAICVPDI